MNAIASLPHTLAAAFRHAGWDVREGAVVGRTAVDAAAPTCVARPGIEARVWAMVGTIGDLAAREIPDEAGEDSLPMYWLGEDDRKQRSAIAERLGSAAEQKIHAKAYRNGEAIIYAARVLAPKARAYVSFSDPDIDRMFATIDDWRRALLEQDISCMEEEMDVAIGRCELLHPIVITDATMQKPWVRLQQTELIGGGTRWLDVVAAEHADDYVRALHQHYNNAFTKRRFR
jgi:hypothetical protein